jgi:hypothetical protein
MTVNQPYKPANHLEAPKSVSLRELQVGEDLIHLLRPGSEHWPQLVTVDLYHYA